MASRLSKGILFRLDPAFATERLPPGQEIHLSVAFLYTRLYVFNFIQASGFLPEGLCLLRFSGFRSEQGKTSDSVGEVERRCLRILAVNSQRFLVTGARLCYRPFTAENVSYVPDCVSQSKGIREATIDVCGFSIVQ